MADSPTLRDEFQSMHQGYTRSNPASPPTSPRRQQHSISSSASPATSSNPFEDPNSQGLGIELGERRASISRKPIGAQSPVPSTPSAKPQPFSNTTPYESPEPSQSKPFLSPNPNQYVYNSGVYTIQEEEVDVVSGRTSPYAGSGYGERMEHTTPRIERNDEGLWGDADDYHKAGKHCKKHIRTKLTGARIARWMSFETRHSFFAEELAFHIHIDTFNLLNSLFWYMAGHCINAAAIWEDDTVHWRKAYA